MKFSTAYQNKRVLIIGMARSGIAAAKLLLKAGGIPILSDSRAEEAFGTDLDELRGTACEFHLGEDTLVLLDNADIVVISPGVPITAPVVQRAKENGIPVLGELEFAYTLLLGSLSAISGTNGKTTTTTLLSEIYKKAGIVSCACGNIGYPISAVALDSQPNDVTIAEVSSFQLESISSFHPHVAALLNITEDHLNRHGTMAEYIRMKQRLFERQTALDYAVLNDADETLHAMAANLPSKVVWFSRTRELDEGAFVRDGMIIWKWKEKEYPICRADELLIPGPHNLENALAAVAMACCDHVPYDAIAAVLQTFAGVEHRIEKVRVLQGVTYINDSKGTNVDSTIKAIESMTRPTVMILGGYDKHTDFMPMCTCIMNHEMIRHAVLIGTTAPQIERQLKESGFTSVSHANSLQNAVEQSRKVAADGWNVLLSPACASFDMFKDFEQRGRVFKDIVNHLE